MTQSGKSGAKKQLNAWPHVWVSCGLIKSKLVKMQ